MKLYDLAAWIGVGLVILAYGLITLEVVVASDATYNLLNIFGAAGIMWSSYKKRDYQPVVLNLVWLSIALVALIKISM